MSRCDLDLWPLDHEFLWHFYCHVFKLSTKFEWNRIIHGWVIDDLAHFRRVTLGGGAELTELSQGCMKIHQTWSGHRAIIAHCTFVLEFGYIEAFSNAGSSKLSGVENDPKFRTFWPPVKISEGVGKTNCWSFTYNRTSRIHLMAIHCVAAECSGLMKKKEKKIYG